VTGLLLACALLAGGCGGAPRKGARPPEEPLSVRIRNLEGQMALLRSENQELRRRSETPPSKLPAGAGVVALYRLREVNVSRYTGFYDKDGHGTLDKLIVYVEPVDTAGDVVKAAGVVEVELWDLSKDPSKALLASWHVGPEDLFKMWLTTLLAVNYRLVFDRPAGVAEDRSLTVKVTFTDGLTGQVITQQRAIPPARKL
jgi:hypothetical protein